MRRTGDTRRAYRAFSPLRPPQHVATACSRTADGLINGTRETKTAIHNQPSAPSLASGTHGR